MMSGSPDPYAQDIERRFALAREWDDLVAQVRQLDGFEDFLSPPRLEMLLPAASAGPVVILNVSRWRCDALIVTTSGVEVMPMSDLRQEDVVARVQLYLDAVGARQAEAARGGTKRDAEPTVSTDAVEDALDDCLQWMWDCFAGEILDHLGYTTVPAGAWPRLWWCPTGPLTLLPIHAAGHHRTPGDAVLDRVISSYTPTLRALMEARTRPGDPSPNSERMLFVGTPTTPHHADLPNVHVEEQLLEELFGDRCTALVGDDATHDLVLAALPLHRWAHFACHGEQDLLDPSRGALLMQDGPLTVADLSSQRYRGEFVYLSGCKTAVGGVHLPDEAITLAAALHYTGYRHVIATLWSIWDEEAAHVATDFYHAMAPDGVMNADGAAQALHHAVRRLRAERRARPSVWTPFAHIGP